MTLEILGIHEYYVTTTTTTTTATLKEYYSRNGLLVLVEANQLEIDMRNIKRRTESLSDVFLHVCEKGR